MVISFSQSLYRFISFVIVAAYDNRYRPHKATPVCGGGTSGRRGVGWGVINWELVYALVLVKLAVWFTF